MQTTFKLELNSKPGQDKRHSILLRITQDRKLKRISTGIFVFKNQFNAKSEHGKWIRRNHPNYVKFNEDLKDFIKQAEDKKAELSKYKQSDSASSIIHSIKEGNTESFIAFFQRMIDKYKDEKSAAFYKNATAKLRKLKLYLKELKQNDLLLHELNVRFLNNYENYLTKQGLGFNTIIGHLKMIRIIFRNAIAEEVVEVEKNPFLKKKISAMKSKKKKLSQHEILEIKKLKLEKDSELWNARNYFLFSFYCAGIRIADLMQLTGGNIKDGRLTYDMGKTDKEHSVKILPAAMEILNQYKTKDSKQSDFIFPILDSRFRKADRIAKRNIIDSMNAIINKNLKKIQKLAAIETNISFHISRHSFADILRQKQTDIYEIKNLLGHTNISQTQNYLKGFDPITADKTHEEALAEF